MDSEVGNRLLARLERLIAVGAALSAERDADRILEMILEAAKELTNADGGTLYRLTEDGRLRFEIVRNDSLRISMGGTTGVPIPFAPVPLHDSGALRTKPTCASTRRCTT